VGVCLCPTRSICAGVEAVISTGTLLALQREVLGLNSTNIVNRGSDMGNYMVVGKQVDLPFKIHTDTHIWMCISMFIVCEHHFHQPGDPGPSLSMFSN